MKGLCREQFFTLHLSTKTAETTLTHHKLLQSIWEGWGGGRGQCEAPVISYQLFLSEHPLCLSDFGWSLQPVVTLKNIQGCNLAINNTLRITKEARLFCSETLQTVCLQKLPENRKQQQNPALNSVGNNNRYAFKQQSYQHKGGVEVGCQEAYRCAASVETLFRAPVLFISIAAVLYLDSS